MSALRYRADITDGIEISAKKRLLRVALVFIITNNLSLSEHIWIHSERHNESALKVHSIPSPYTKENL